jgi:hypothetical protein
MKKVLLWTFLGFLLLVPGVFLAFLYLQGVEKGASLFLLIAGILLSGGGVFMLYKAGTQDTNKIKFADAVPSEDSSILSKNNEMISEWNKTNEARDRLKILQASATPEEN